MVRGSGGTVSTAGQRKPFIADTVEVGSGPRKTKEGTGTAVVVPMSRLCMNFPCHDEWSYCPEGLGGANPESLLCDQRLAPRV